MKPVVVLVGRPNVGKSTLFNRLTRSRAALVADEPGLTRDRQYGDGRIGDRPYLVVDTGGLAGAPREAQAADILALISRQTQQAIAEADAVILLTDARDGVTALDRDIASGLRRTGKPVWLAVNKAEGLDPYLAAVEFHALGLGEPHAVSAAHGEGVAALMEAVLATLPAVVGEEAESDTPRIAVVGRPNVGKSTLVNAMLGEERVLVYDQAGTTRDAVHVPFQHRGQPYVLIDTAGVRRRGRIERAVEKYSVIKTLQAIDEADVVLLVLDAQAGIAEQDASLAGYVLKHGRALVPVVNKWDTVASAERAWVRREVERKLGFLTGVARMHYVSAREGSGIEALYPAIRQAFTSTTRVMPTARLNRVLQEAVLATPPPMVRGRRIRLKYAHQGAKRPPTVIVHGNQVAAMPASYRRYLAGVFRKAFGLSGVPVRIECREGDNPFAERPPSGRRKVTARTARKR